MAQISPTTVYRKNLQDLYQGTTMLSLSPMEMKNSALSRFQHMSPAPLCDFDPSPPCIDARGSDNISPDQSQISPDSIKPSNLLHSFDTPTPGSLKKLSLDTPSPSLEPTKLVLDTPSPCLGPTKLVLDTPSPDVASSRKFSLDSTTYLPKLSLDALSPSPKKHNEDIDETSQDSGVHMASEFKYPERPSSFLSRAFSFSGVSHQQQQSPVSSPATTPTSAPPTIVSSPSVGPSILRYLSPVMSNSQSSNIGDDDTDDGFHDDLIDEGKENIPMGMSQLMKAPMINQKVSLSTTPHKPQSSLPGHVIDRRGLFRSPSAPKLLEERRCKQKRGEDDEDVIVRPSLKRRKSVQFKNLSQEPKAKPPPSARTLQRCHSEIVIKTALSRADTTDAPLIGDCSREYCLPLCQSKHQDLRGINPKIMKDLLDGKFEDTVGKYMIIDCRYPYEYEGGHIEGAVNLYTKTDIFEKFMSHDEYRQSSAAPNKRNILIFHCEFSSERGPKMSRFLRNKDRDANKECYPSLHYPEIYLLEGGYKNFWEQYPEKCTLNGAYKPMLHQDHGDDLKKFRAKSKTWAGEKTGGRSRTALKVRF